MRTAPMFILRFKGTVQIMAVKKKILEQLELIY